MDGPLTQSEFELLEKVALGESTRLEESESLTTCIAAGLIAPLKHWTAKGLYRVTPAGLEALRVHHYEKKLPPPPRRLRSQDRVIPSPANRPAHRIGRAE